MSSLLALRARAYPEAEVDTEDTHVNTAAQIREHMGWRKSDPFLCRRGFNLYCKWAI